MTSTEPDMLPEASEADMAQLLRQAWAGKYWVLLFTILFGLAGTIYTKSTPPTYRADALMQLEDNSRQMTLPNSIRDLTSGTPRSVTEIEILYSRLVLGQAVADTHMDWIAEPRRVPVIGEALNQLGLPLPDLPFLRPFANGGESIEMDLLEVPPQWIGRGILLTIENEAATNFSLLLPDQRVITGSVGEQITDERLGFGIRVRNLQGEQGREFIIAQIDEGGAIIGLRNNLSVFERGGQSSILELSLTGGDPREIERGLHAITQAYLRQNVSRSAAEAQSSLEFVESQLPDAEAAAREAENALNAYRQAQQAIDLGFEAQSLLTQVSSIEVELQQLDAQEDELSQRYTTNHPNYQQLLSNRARLEERLERLRSDVGELPETQREVFNLTRNLELAREVYGQLLNRVQELQVLRASTIGNVRIVDVARASPIPIAPRERRTIALSIILGMMAGVGFVFLRLWLRRGVQSAEQIDALGLLVFATVNVAPQAENAHKRKGAIPILALTDPGNLSVEGFRSLRTSLHFAMMDSRTNSVALTSPAPGVGKSFTAVNLAVVAAQAGQRVCLVDADIRRGYLRRYFDIAKDQQGLSDFLAGEAKLDKILLSTEVPKLSVITTGHYPPNPSELLMSSSLQDLMRQLDSRFDLIIVDTPPALAVTDPVIVGRQVGATIAVARFDVTPLREIDAMHRLLRSSGVNVAGAVLNGFDPARAKVSSGYAYSASYRYEYKSAGE
ncbi:polysaccharide biosynthesis tyrosine autokinase [Seohaeicola saemankumensis]|uniref:polysaccharide biosynthesis tyrosine autokinase n=1 Tax=Seohaeicola saemankumensis TaxID=481181 RepID=UPI001E323C01|nr:polysaccharide biosynthesis tyrosine autokinase [Seohaeicola saemankumensis]MCD1627370.1 polysaccharide biosynthesis tyrosine autokinase [Seohaeicola saemankumensis]